MSASEPSDDDLIARIARGDRDAFAALYRRRRPDVYRFALLMSGSAAIADDVTQDAFVDVIHHAMRYRAGQSGVVPWLFGIARNHARRAQQRQRPSVPIDAAVAATPRPFAIDDDPLTGLARREHIAALRRAIFELPIAYR